MKVRLVARSPALGGLVRRVARLRPLPQDAADLVMVQPPADGGGWILDAICREFGERLHGLRVGYCRHGQRLPPARRYFFSHYMFYVWSLAVRSPLHQADNFVFATHLEPAKNGIANAALARVLNGCQGIVCMNRGLQAELGALGVAPGKMNVVVGGVDPRRFVPHPRAADGTVGFCSAYYPRKSPDLILEVVRGLPHRAFVLLGKGWREYPRFAELAALPNFTYVETSYEDYPAHYAKMSVFVSPSRLEGGPIPLLEAMMSNVVPVASRTGFAPDVIEHGRNGLLFDVDAPAPQVCGLVEQAFGLGADVHESVRHCDWDAFSRRLAGVLGLAPAP